MSRNYPTDLKVGDVMHTKTGRTYTVAAYDSAKREVSYAYIPWDSDGKQVVIDTRPEEKLNWVFKVTNEKGYRVWEQSRPVSVGDMVDFEGRQYEVTRVRQSSVDLKRTIEKYWISKQDVRVL